MNEHLDAQVAAMKRDLEAHMALCNEILALVTREHQTLSGMGEYNPAHFDELRKTLLPKLDQSLYAISQHRTAWQQYSAQERARHPEAGALLRSNMDLIMKIIVLDRENEQILLRRGMVPPRHLPSINRQRPHFVADLYRRSGTT